MTEEKKDRNENGEVSSPASASGDQSTSNPANEESGRQSAPRAEEVKPAGEAAAEKPASGAEGAAGPAEKPAPEKPAPPRAPAAARPAAPAAAKKAPSITAEITGDPLVDRIREKFGPAITEAVATLNQQILRVAKDSLVELCRFLHDDPEALFDMCTDLTAIHWPERAGEEFDIVIQLYSVPKNRRLRIKTAVADGDACPSVTSIYSGADWMEREVFDMFGVKFQGHSDLRRILLPEDWPGHPLRKDYPVEYRDNEWTDRHLEFRELDYDASVCQVKYSERK